MLVVKNYVLADSFNKPNIQKNLWYAMEEADKDTLKEEQVISFGDQVYVIKTKKVYIMGNDNTWYEM
jgi:hypothetical protein